MNCERCKNEIDTDGYPPTWQPLRIARDMRKLSQAHRHILMHRVDTVVHDHNIQLMRPRRDARPAEILDA